MKDTKKVGAGYYNPDDCNLSDFREILDQDLAVESVPNAAEIENNIPIYDIKALHKVFQSKELRIELMAEWAWVLRESSGAIVLRGAYQDTSAIDEATELYQKIIASEKLNSGGGADHFATAGANDRIWNSLQKLCETSPDVFLRYFANVPIQTACEAWLGPNYQMTAQVNLGTPWW